MNTLCTFGPPLERKRKFILRFEDRFRGEMFFDDEGEAVAMFLRCTDVWNCTLFGTVEMRGTEEAKIEPEPRETMCAICGRLHPPGRTCR